MQRKTRVASDTTERSKNNCTQSKVKTHDVHRGQGNVDIRSHCSSTTMQDSIPEQFVLSFPSTPKINGSTPLLN